MSDFIYFPNWNDISTTTGETKTRSGFDFCYTRSVLSNSSYFLTFTKFWLWSNLWRNKFMATLIHMLPENFQKNFRFANNASIDTKIILLQILPMLQRLPCGWTKCQGHKGLWFKERWFWQCDLTETFK